MPECYICQSPGDHAGEKCPTGITRDQIDRLRQLQGKVPAGAPRLSLKAERRPQLKPVPDLVTEDDDGDEVDFTVEGVQRAREIMIELHDGAVEVGRKRYAMGLSHGLTYLATYQQALGSMERAFADLETGSG